MPLQREDRSREISRDVRDLAPVLRGLGALYSSDDGLTLNAHALSALRDLGTGLCDLAQGTGASQPLQVAQVAGVRSSIRFDGSNDQISRAIADGLKPSARGLSVVFVAQGRTGSTGDYPPAFSARPWTAVNDVGWAISCNGSASSGVFTTHFDSGVTEAGGWDHSSFPGARGLSTTQRELWCFVFDIVNARLRHYRNGVIDSEFSPTYPVTNPIVPTADFRIGADRAVGVGTRFLAMDLFRAAIHTEPLTATEVETYWARWGSLCGVRP